MMETVMNTPKDLYHFSVEGYLKGRYRGAGGICFRVPS